MIYNETRYNSHWNTKKLSELGTFARGKSKHRPRDDERLYEGGGYPLIQTGDVKAANLYITQHEQEYGAFGLAQSKLWDAGTLCITIAANIAETAILGYPMCFPDSVVGFSAFPEESSEKFMHYVFTYIRNSIQNSVAGSIQDNINIDYLSQLDFKVPPKSYQDKVVEVLGNIDEKIDTNNRICTELESMAKTLYDYWFTQFDFPNAEGKPYRSSGGEMVWNDQLKREIPKGWSNCKLKDYANSVTRSTSHGEHLRDLFYTPIDEIPKRQMSFWGGLPYTEANSSLQLYQEDDILIGAMRVYFHRVCIAAQRGITRSTTMVLQAQNKEDLAFIYELFNHDQTIQYANKISVGTQQPYVNWDDSLDSMDVIAPAHSVIVAFCKHIDPIIEKVKCLVQENYELIKLRDWLLPMLMNGQATVE